MQVYSLPAEIFNETQRLRFQEKSIGMVPTMGALHEGHFHLVKQARKENDILIVSIFVNPLQFNNQEDLDNYPRTLEKDLSHLEKLGVDLVFAPAEENMYPEKPQVSIVFGQMERVMEGAFRPGHFSGVGVVVTKLFNICNPTRAYFGKKDMQQYLLVKRMVEDLSQPVEIIGVPIVREPSGLAMSSRNQRLSNDGLEIASSIYKGLTIAKQEWDQAKSPDETKNAAIAFYNKQEGLSIEYINIVSPHDLEDLDENVNQPAVICVAGFVEGVRLIDNLYLRQD
ncbi:pantoate--beta-alanine ligase [Marinoscillum pacificum]|uniref:pantoate--beta-alanine ligase n=1 Tax=Marinoscillum pacificum TaxID=392723 RepID=UPI002157BAFA|nr:pantoate--beta-alanine ligase [Marinoscillum pacificum]